MGDDGHLYGTTELGGKSDRGTVYELTPPGKTRQSWKESVLYSFGGGAGGFAPDGGLNPGKGGALYGTTIAGGNTSCDSGNGCGIVFRVKP